MIPLDMCVPEKEKVLRASIGLHLITMYPDWGLVAILRRRALYKTDELGRCYREPYAGATVCPAHGKTKWQESPMDTLRRKGENQLSPDFCCAIRLDDRDIHLLVDNPEKQCKTFGVCVLPRYIGLIRFDTASAGIVRLPLNKLDKVRVLTDVDRERPITDLLDIAMFADELEALRRVEGNRQLLAYLRRCT